MSEALPQLPPRRQESHKGDYGRALLVGGSRGMAGAIALAGMATARAGAGLVKLAVPDVCLETVAGFEPSYMTAPLDCDALGRIARSARRRIVELAAESTAMALGPGLGRGDELTDLVGRLYRELTLPMVVDADALNALSHEPDALVRPGGPRILTPHPGEFDRLVGRTNLGSDERGQMASDLALRSKAIVLLKGHRTLITDGRRQAVNATGNPGMATGGVGDVLTGVILALVCQGLGLFEAAQLGAHVHGLAGDLAAGEKGQVSLIARDLIDYLPRAFQNK